MSELIGCNFALSDNKINVYSLVIKHIPIAQALR